MKSSPRFLNAVLEIAHVEFQTYDLGSNKLLFSSGVCSKLLGYTPEEYHQFSDDFYAALIHPDDREKVLETVRKLQHSPKGEIIEMTVRVLKHDGNYIWIYSRQMLLEKGVQSGSCTIIREAEDITQVIELEEQLRDKVELLQTISYKNSHLIRSPVASIIGLVNMVEEHGITGEHNMQIFHYLKQAIEKLDVVIHEINDIANK